MGVSYDHYTGLLSPQTGDRLRTTIYGYGQSCSDDDTTNDIQYTWPGPTFEINSHQNNGPKNIYITWNNNLRETSHILPVDTTIHWAFATSTTMMNHNSDDSYHHSHHSSQEHNNTNKVITIEEYGIPVSPHLHGGFTDEQYDGNAEAYFTPDHRIIGPYWTNRYTTIQHTFTNEFQYDNSLRASSLWYHDHTLGITRLNVYAGLVGFYIVRDQYDTGDVNNVYNLPYGKYELLYMIQDKMFTNTGQLFIPSKFGDPTYNDYITDQGITLDSNFGPTAVAEFFGDFITVNGKIWPKKFVQPTVYRLRLLNACDSRYLVIQFVVVPSNNIINPNYVQFSTEQQKKHILDFTVIGSDGGLGTPQVFTAGVPLVIEPAARYDILLDFSSVPGQRVIIQNLARDEPFGGTFDDPYTTIYTDHTTDRSTTADERYTNRIMAFDVGYINESNSNNHHHRKIVVENNDDDNVTVDAGPQHQQRSLVRRETKSDSTTGSNNDRNTGTRTIGHDSTSSSTSGSGTSTTIDYIWEGIHRPDSTTIRQLAIMEGSDEYGRIQPILGSKTLTDDNIQLYGEYTAYPWSYPIITEQPLLYSTEEWYLLNFSEDAHSMHMHLVEFQVVSDFTFQFTIDDDMQYVIQHNGNKGSAPKFTNIRNITTIQRSTNYYDNSPKDSVTVLPGSDPSNGYGYGTIIRIEFNKFGLYSWHCHILSHEDHEMMRPYEVI